MFAFFAGEQYYSQSKSTYRNILEVFFLKRDNSQRKLTLCGERIKEIYYILFFEMYFGKGDGCSFFYIIYIYILINIFNLFKLL